MKAPIFIIGYPRSGTSFVGKLIAKFTGYPSHGESHTIPLLQELHHQINLYRRRDDFTGRELVKQLDLQPLKELNTRYFRDFYLNTYGSENFIDKTPGSVACHGWGVVKEVFPSAAFVACVRSPVEIIESATIKFQDANEKSQTAPEICKGWVGAMQGIKKLQQSPYSCDLHVVSQLELRVDPRKAVGEIFRFLGVPMHLLDEAINLCQVSRDDVLTNSIMKSEYKTLESLNVPPPLEDELRTICSATCNDWNIAI